MGMSAERSVTVNKGKERSENVDLRGASPAIAVISNYQAENGRFFSETENRQRMNVAFIGHDIQTKFFGEGDPLGQTIDIDGHSVCDRGRLQSQRVGAGPVAG